MNIVIGIAGVLVTLGVVIFIHELGHFLACKLVGIRVIKFAFAFGKEIFGFDWKGTRYSLGWIPLGGFVKPAGEDYFERDKKEKAQPKPDEYFGKPWYKRLFVVIAGPFMNYVLALFIFTFVFWIWGGNAKFLNTTVIGAVKADMPAAAAGLKDGDKIIKIQDIAVTTWKQMAGIIHKNSGSLLSITVERDNLVLVKHITPVLDKDAQIGLIGIYPDMQLQKMSFFASAKNSAQMVWMISSKTISYLGGSIKRLEKPKDVSGPIGIFKYISDAANTGFRELISLIGFLSVAIGLFNLFPIPMLDGGHMVFYIFEGILRKPLNEKVMVAANYVGFALLITLVLYASYNDIVRLCGSNKDAPVEVVDEK